MNSMREAPDEDSLIQRIETFFYDSIKKGVKGPFDRAMVAQAIGEEENTVAKMLGIAFRQQKLYRHTPNLGSKKEGPKLYWALEDCSCDHLAKDPFRERKVSVAAASVEGTSSALKRSGWRDEVQDRKTPLELAAPKPMQDTTSTLPILAITAGLNCQLNSQGELMLAWPYGGVKFEPPAAKELWNYLQLFKAFPA